MLHLAAVLLLAGASSALVGPSTMLSPVARRQSANRTLHVVHSLRGGAAVAAAVAPSSADAAARVLGYAMGAGSIGLYLPILANVVMQGSADGLSMSTWAMNAVGFTFSAAYNTQKGFPLSAYLDTCTLTVQSALILAVTATLQERPKSPVVRTAIGLTYLATAAFLFSPLCPTRLLAALQVVATGTSMTALIPQVMMNHRNKSGGQWSPITAGLSASGCAVRIFTTLQLTKDKLLLFGFAAGFALNAALLSQILYYGKKNKKAGV